MVIRCERCSTMYELEESLLASTGSQVQCTKCQHVFTAYPPNAPGRTLVGVPAQPAPVEKPDAPRAAPPEPTEPYPPPASRAQAAPREPSAPRVTRTGGPPPVYRPPTGPPPTATRGAVVRRDSVGTFEARLRATARWRWLGPALAVALVAAGAAGWLLLSRRADPEARRAQAEAIALIALDDRASLERASMRLTEAARRAPGVLAALSADRALSLVLRSASLADEAEALAARAALRAEEREERGDPRAQAPERAAGEHAVSPAEVREREEQAAALGRNAFEAIRAAQAEAGDTQEVTRALALHHASRGERERASALIRAARQQGTRDGWIELADAWLDARDPDRAVRERAAVKLVALGESHAGLLRGRYLLARTQASLGRRAEALAVAEAVLAANPKHEPAKRLRDELSAAASAPAVQAPAPVAVKPPAPRRKIPPQVEEGAGAPRATGTAASGPAESTPGGTAAPPARPPPAASSETSGPAATALPAPQSAPPTPAPAPRSQAEPTRPAARERAPETGDGG